MYKDGVENTVSEMTRKETWKNDWVNEMCDVAKGKKYCIE